MKGLLLASKSLVLMIFLHACQSNSGSEGKSSQFAQTDTLPQEKVQALPVADTGNSSVHSGVQQTSVAGSAGEGPGRSKSSYAKDTVPVRIEHRSDDQQKLDSIKDAKNKLKGR